MPLAPLCRDTQWLHVVPWAVGAFYGLILLVMLVAKVLTGNRKIKFLPFLFGVGVMAGILFYIRSTYAGQFQEFELAGGTLTMKYLWPTKEAAIQTSTIESIAVVRGRHFRKSTRSDDRAWLRIRAAGKAYDSCESDRINDLAQLGRDLGSKTNHAPVWQERCPDPDNRAVDATEAQVTAPGRMNVPAACGSAR